MLMKKVVFVKYRMTYRTYQAGGFVQSFGVPSLTFYLLDSIKIDALEIDYLKLFQKRR